MYLLKARKMVANEFVNNDFPKELRPAYADFLDHSEFINKLHYCTLDVANIFRIIVPVLDGINNKFEDIADNDESFLAFKYFALGKNGKH